MSVNEHINVAKQSALCKFNNRLQETQSDSCFDIPKEVIITVVMSLRAHTGA